MHGNTHVHPTANESRAHQRESIHPGLEKTNCHKTRICTQCKPEALFWQEAGYVGPCVCVYVCVTKAGARKQYVFIVFVLRPVSFCVGSNDVLYHRRLN